MKRALLVAGLLLALSSMHAAASPVTVAAAAAPASADSVRQLMEETQSRQLLDKIHAQVEASLAESMKMGLGDAKLTSGQTQIIDDVRKKMSALLREELSWSRFEPMMIDIYQQTFSQHEVEGMLAFYRSDAGKAVISKMPRTMEITMQRTQEMVADMVPKMQKIAAEMLEAIKADAEQQRKAATP
jgi:hypothetical protein